MQAQFDAFAASGRNDTATEIRLNGQLTMASVHHGQEHDAAHGGGGGKAAKGGGKGWLQELLSMFSAAASTAWLQERS